MADTDTPAADPPGLPAAAGTGTAVVIRSAEQLLVGTEKVTAGRAYLRRRVVTEDRTITVQVSHDEVDLIHEPVEPGTGPAVSGSPAGDGATEMILTEERVVVTKEVVPVERVRLRVESVTEQRTVTDTVRKEHIELHHDTSTGADGDGSPDGRG